MSLTIYCKLCADDYELVGGDVPWKCPSCNRETKWTTMQPFDRTPELWTAADRRLLRSMLILAD